MGNLAITPANVAKNEGTEVTGVAAVAMTAGQLIFVDDGNDRNITLSDASAAATALCDGVTLNDAGANQPVTWLKLAGGVINPGAVVAVGQGYAVSATPGAIALEADILVGEILHLIGAGKSASLINLGSINSGVAHA